MKERCELQEVFVLIGILLVPAGFVISRPLVFSCGFPEVPAGRLVVVSFALPLK